MGNPKRVNQLAHQQLLGLKTKSQLPVIDEMMSVLSRWSGIVLVFLAVIILVLFREQLSDIFKSRDNGDEEQEIELVQPLEHIEAVKVDGSKSTMDGAGIEELESLLAELPDEAASPEDLTEPEELTPPVQLASEQVPAAVSIFGVDWISQQLPTNYTFQLMGSWEREEIDAFINRHHLVGDVAVFESLRNGRVWYALIYGSFVDKGTALKASKQWPAPLNSLPSWLRRFDSVQQQIKNNAVIG